MPNISEKIGMSVEKFSFHKLLEIAVEKGASDLHLVNGVPPMIRVDGHLVPVGNQVLERGDVWDLVHDFLSPERKTDFDKRKEHDFSFSFGEEWRIRANFHYQRGGIGCAFRFIPKRVPDLDSLNLPSVVKEFAYFPRGLVLVTGPTGSGKSTTIAALLDVINRMRKVHIITIEDPIEYLHDHIQSVVEQREVGEDTHSFAEALRHVLRQDPDVILVGEMRDLETVRTAITAAETGHLVFSTLHTNDAVQSIDRLVDAFPAHQQQQIRIQLSMTLAGIVSQQLLPRIDGPGRVVATEILRANSGIRNLVRQAKTAELASMIEIGGAVGMHTMDSALVRLVREGKIARKQAEAAAVNLENLKHLMERG